MILSLTSNRPVKSRLKDVFTAPAQLAQGLYVVYSNLFGL